MTIEELMKIAVNARRNAVTPITGYKVGAALLTQNGSVYMGVNVEDREIPSLSNCAERVAIQNAMTHGEREFDTIVVVGGKKASSTLEILSPCGACLQYMAYFSPDLKVACQVEGKITTKPVLSFLSVPYHLQEETK